MTNINDVKKCREMSIAGLDKYIKLLPNIDFTVKGNLSPYQELKLFRELEFYRKRATTACIDYDFTRSFTSEEVTTDTGEKK